MVRKAAKLGQWEVDAATGAMHLSAEAKAVLGLIDGQDIKTLRAFQDLIHEQDREEAITCFDKAISDRMPFDMECRIAMPDETKRWISNIGFSVDDPSSSKVKVLGVIADIDHRK